MIASTLATTILAGFILWVIWCVINLLVMLLVSPDAPHATGFGVTIPERYKTILTEEEYDAVYAHELGHVYKLHAWKNFFLVCTFRQASRVTRAFQELEADDYAMKQGKGAALASALRKLSVHPIDIARAARLEKLIGPQDAGDLTGRDARAVNQEKQT